MYVHCQPRPANWGNTNYDCATRAIAIAHYITCHNFTDEIAYRLALAHLTMHIMRERGRTGKVKGGVVRNGRVYSHPTFGGVFKPTFDKAMAALGWTWVSCGSVGKPSRVKITPEDLPAGAVILRLSRHYSVAIDGIAFDTHDPTRDGKRMVYGYWLPPEHLR